MEKVAICRDTPFLKQFDHLCRLRLEDVGKDMRMVYMICSKENFTPSVVESFAGFVVANCLNLP